MFFFNIFEILKYSMCWELGTILGFGTLHTDLPHRRPETRRILVTPFRSWPHSVWTLIRMISISPLWLWILRVLLIYSVFRSILNILQSTRQIFFWRSSITLLSLITLVKVPSVRSVWSTNESDFVKRIELILLMHWTFLCTKMDKILTLSIIKKMSLQLKWNLIINRVQAGVRWPSSWNKLLNYYFKTFCAKFTDWIYIYGCNFAVARLLLLST